MTRPFLFGLIGLALVSFGCSDRLDPNAKAEARESVKPASDGERIQGWTAQDRQDFYHLAEGSELYPLTWVKALIDLKTQRPFLELPERFGLVKDPNDPDGLPIGISAHESRGVTFLGRMIGVNCAACHVGQIQYKGKSFLIDGAPNQFDLNNFYLDLFAAVGKTVKDPREMAAFMARIEKSQGGAVSERTKALINGLSKVLSKQESDRTEDEKSFADQSSSLIDQVKGDLKQDASQLLGLGKSGREALKSRLRQANARAIDGLTETIASGSLAKVVMKDVAAKRAEIRDSVADMAVDAALIHARLEFLKKLARMHSAEKIIPGPGRIDAFGSIRDMVMPAEDMIDTTSPVSYPHLWQVGQTVWLHWDGNTNTLMQRNVGQSMGLGAVFDPRTGSSTVLPRQLYKLDELTRVLKAPTWPDILPPIDRDKAARGKALFASHCMKCHASSDETDVDKRERVVDLEVIKTDPTRVENYAIPVDRKNGGSSFAQALRKAAAGFTKQAYLDNDINEGDQAKMDLPADKIGWRTNHGYVSRPLVAPWATAPYLHNGSIPTLYDLLLPADQRPRSFYVGYREFDPVKVGYVYEESRIPAASLTPPTMKYDATIKGNLNSGHEFGTKLDESQKMDLIEYLKSS